MMIGTPPPNRDRFLAAIAERVSPDRVQALFLFAPMRQGPIETGVAVIAVDQPIPALVIVDERVIAVTGEFDVQADADASVELDGMVEPEVVAQPVTPNLASPNPVVMTARYKHTLKGADRGKWEVEILEQADAPLITVEMVVRGVQQRLDDASDPERLGADELRKALADGVWTAPQR